MVDIRPLLFANLLILMLMATAGFVRYNDALINQIPNASVPEEAEPPLFAEESASETFAESIEDGSLEDESKVSSIPRPDEAEDEKGDDALFVDTSEPTPPTPKELSTEAQQEVSSTAENNESTANTTAPVEATAPAAEVIEATPAVIEKPKKQESITGVLIVNSNVKNDTVLVNGKPYGATQIQLDLTPGSYAVEVAKPGYESWQANVDIRRGQTQRLNARLKQYTTVTFKDGKWLNNIKTGEGTYEVSGKLSYNGSFVNGKFHGIGNVRYSDGSKYQGEWFEGEMQGKGSLTTSQGDTYVGELEENKFSGEGTLTKATGDIYSGFWIDGELNGQGSLTTKNGMLYVGGFADNLFHGNGSLTYPDGGHYEGSFSNGLYHGKGVEVYPNGRKYVGQFIDGLYHGKGELFNPNGSKIEGTFRDGKPFGKATLTTPDGEVFTARSSEPGVCYRLKSYRATECPELEGWD